MISSARLLWSRVCLSAVCILAGAGAGAFLRPDVPPAIPAPVALSSPAGGPLDQPGRSAESADQQFLTNTGTPVSQLAAALRLGEGGTVADIRALLDDARRFPPHAASRVARAVLLKRWLALEPEGALDYCRIHEIECLPRLLGTWAVTHPEEAEAWIRGLPLGETKSKAWKELYATVATQTPETAWKLLEQDSRVWANAKLVQKLVASDLDGAISRLGSLPSELLDLTRKAIAKEIMKTDPSRGWDWVCRQPNPTELIGSALGESFHSDPAAALACFQKMTPDQQKIVLRQYTFGWGNKDAARLATALENEIALSEETRQTLAERFYTNTSYKDPEGTARLVPYLGESFLTDNVDSFVIGWKEKDAAAAAEWVASLPAGPVRTKADAALQPPPATVPTEDQNPVDSLVHRFANNGYLQASDGRIGQLTPDQLNQMLSGPDTNTYTHQLLIGLVEQNPATATAWLEAASIDQKSAPFAAEFSARWAQEDPTAAAAWVSQLPAGDLATNTAANVARQYVRYAPDEAIAWTESLPSGPAQDAAREALRQ